MISVKILPIGSKTSIFDPAKFKRAIENAGNETSKAVEVDFNVTVRTWKHKPDFKIDHTNGSGEWEISTDDKIYKFVSEGTKPHIIRARNAPRLAFFRSGFRPKSRVGWIGSNVGAMAKKDFMRPYSVVHPGTDPREFAQAIKKKWDNEWPRQLQRAIRAAAKYGGK